MLIDKHVWTFTSTGTGSGRQFPIVGANHTWHIQADAASSGTVIFQAAASTASTAAWGVIGSTTGYALSSAQGRTIQFSGAYGALRPRISGSSGSSNFRVELIVEGTF